MYYADVTEPTWFWSVSLSFTRDHCAAYIVTGFLKLNISVPAFQSLSVAVRSICGTSTTIQCLWHSTKDHSSGVWSFCYVLRCTVSCHNLHRWGFASFDKCECGMARLSIDVCLNILTYDYIRQVNVVNGGGYIVMLW